MHQITWRLSALNELAALWADADSALRDEITAAAAAIDESLGYSPEQVGESRSHNQRVGFVKPLGFTFRVRAADQSVTVFRVWLTKRRNA